jgi:hypothetical protein
LICKHNFGVSVAWNWLGTSWFASTILKCRWHGIDWVASPPIEFGLCGNRVVRSRV